MANSCQFSPCLPSHIFRVSSMQSHHLQSGKSENSIGFFSAETSDEFLHRLESDENLTEPHYKLKDKYPSCVLFTVKVVV
jgi:hypothetical protein